MPVASPWFTLKVSQELISFYTTEFRVPPEEWASMFVKLTLHVLFHQDRLKRGNLNYSQITDSAVRGTFVLCSPVFNLSLKCLEFMQN